MSARAREIVAEAHESNRSVRLHLVDGEVVVAAVIWVDEDRFGYAALTSSHPERYAVCDSTGVTVGFAEVERAHLLR